VGDAIVHGREEGVSKALEGIRVLDLTQWLQGPVCAQYLADFGAQVIHVERPVTGDGARGVRSIKALPVGDWNQYFLVINRNKKSIAIDLKKEAGRDLLCDLAAKADVFLSNFPIDVLRGLGLTYEKLSEINPGLVYATNTGYGHAVEVNRPSYDINVQALTGIMTRQGEPGQPPIYLGMGSGDTYGGMMSAFGILLALHHRRRTGRGQFIDASLYGAQLFMGAPTLQPFLASRNPFYAKQQSRKDARNPLWNRYQAKDKWLFLCAENSDEDWSKLCGTLDAPDVAGDARFASSESRGDNHVALVEALGGAIAKKSAQEWTDLWREAGLVASPIRNLKELSEDPQAWENDYLMKTHCAEVDREVEIRGLPITLSKTPGSVETLGPELGQDTEILLMEVLEMEWDRIEELKAEGVIP
jgi:crotonobetainyl-CoA:carnitine CoA-transferase CaiB-like acyl-CoA transferase